MFVLVFFFIVPFVIYEGLDDASPCPLSSLLLRTESPLVHLLLWGDLTCCVADGVFCFLFFLCGCTTILHLVRHRHSIVSGCHMQMGTVCFCISLMK